MKNKKWIILFLLFLLSLQFLLGATYFNFNDRSGNEIKNPDPELSDVQVGNYTVPGVSGSISSDQLIKIGLLTDMEHFVGVEQWKGALLAAREINEFGININETLYYVGLAVEDTDETNATLDVSKGIAAANRMLTYNDPHFIIGGGTNNESVTAYLEPIMDAQIPILSIGVSGDGFCQKVNQSYSRYKYYFRIYPQNATSIGTDFITYIGYLRYYIGPIYGGTLDKIAILREDLNWTQGLSDVINSVLSAYIEREIAFPINASEDDFSSYWNNINNAGVQLTIPMISTNASIPMVKSYSKNKPKCFLVGINLFGQFASYWDDTEGACQYEILMNGLLRTNKTYKTIPFWDNFVEQYGYEPSANAGGSYTAVKILANVSTPIESFNSNKIVNALEDFNRTNPYISAGGNIAFTNFHDLVSGYPYAYGLYSQWRLDGNRVVVPSYVTPGYPGYYPSSLSTGSISAPYWGINNLVDAQDLPGNFTLSSNAESPDLDGTFNLTWTNSEGADNYSIYLYDKNINYIHKNLTLLADQNATSPFSISGLEYGDYYFVVVAYNETGQTFSNNIYVRVEFPPGEFILTSDAGTPDIDGTFSLTWTNSEGADNYSIYLYDDNITYIHEDLTLLADQNATSPFLISGLKSGDYFFVVVAYNETGEIFSNNIYVRVEIPPGEFTLSSDAGTPDIDGTFNLTWTNSEGADNYSVFINTKKITEINNSIPILANQSALSPFPISGLETNIYYIVVVAYNIFNYTISNNYISVDVQIYNELSGYWILNPIIIDDSGNGDYTWSQVAMLPWCSGTGTSSNPYIFESLKIDGKNSGSCLTISNSSVYFVIKDSIFYNSGSNSNEGGLKLVSVSNGELTSNNCSQNNGNGIILNSCNDIDISENTVNDNGLNGIKLINSENINIENNDETISNNNQHGIYLDNSDNNDIIGNTISNNQIGIYFDQSNDNTIKNNDLRNNDKPYEEINSVGNTFESNLGIPKQTPFPLDLLLIVLIGVIVIVGAIITVIIVKKRKVKPEREKKELSESQKEKIRRKLIEKLNLVDQLIEVNKINSAYKNLGKIKDKADQYEFFDIFNKANEKVEICKDIEEGIYKKVEKEETVMPVEGTKVKEDEEVIQALKKAKEFNVFLSYSTLDADHFQIKRIVKHLERFPEIKKVYYYSKDSGQNIVEYMENTLSVCNIFVLFCSKRSKESKSVEGEWQSAYQLVKRDVLKIIPVYENEENIPILLITMLNVKYDRENFKDFIKNLYEEILR
ncbi:MAG: NosD domain-containing protein [Promethearchaeota archaeon]